MEQTSNYQKHKSKNPIQQFLIRNFYTTFINVLKPLPDIETVLDVGCGEGFTLERLWAHNIGKKLEGIDFSKEAIALGKKTYPTFIFKQGSIYRLPYKDSSFDLVVSTEVLEHLEDPKKAFKELIRVSNKYLLLSVPNEPFFTMQRILRGKNIMQLGKHSEHLNYWTGGEFEAFVKKEPVKIIAKKYPFPWTMLLLKTSRKRF